MGYIHSVAAVMVAKDITERRMKLSKLQQEFYNMVKEFVLNDPETLAKIEAEEDWYAYLEGLRRDIAGMNAAELRHNIKVWRDTE